MCKSAIGAQEAVTPTQKTESRPALTVEVEALLANMHPFSPLLRQLSWLSRKQSNESRNLILRKPGEKPGLVIRRRQSQ